MLQLVLRRLVIYVPMLWVTSMVVFLIIVAPPGDYLSDYIAQLTLSGQDVDYSEIEHLKRRYGFDQSVVVQYWKWFSGILVWDLGDSLEYNRPVTELLNARLGMTALLGALTILFTWTMAIPIGIVSAVKQYSIIDHTFTFLAYLGVGTPNFVLALVIMWTAFSYFDIRITGLYSPEYVDVSWSFGRVIDVLKHIWVPMLILGTDGTARFTRIMRANLLDELSKPYVETARAKGLAEWKVILKYPSRIAINPFISTAGWALPQLFSGSLIVATVMSLPTVGPLLLRALWSQDMYMAGSILFILTGLTLLGTLISDILLGWLDPRIRLAM